MRYLGLLFAGMMATALLNAQGHRQLAPDYFHYQVWSTEDGLPQVTVHALLQSSQGYLWIATENGAARFDGQSFRVLNQATVPAFASDDVSCVAETQAGDIWFGTSGGIVRKHGEQYRRFTQQDGLPSDQIIALASSADGLLVLTTSGLAAWHGDHFEHLVTNELITGLESTDRGAILVSKKGGVFQWSHGQLKTIVPETPDGPALLGAAIGGEHGTWSYGSNFVQFSSPPQKEMWKSGVDLPGNRVQSLYVDSGGTAWVGTNRGLVSLKTAAGFPVREVEALRGESILSVLVDREGDLWVGTEASGLHALQPRKFATVPGSNSEAVTTVMRDTRGIMYFGTRDDGIFRSDGSIVPVASGKLTSPVILSLAAGHDGDLWAGTPDGLNHIAGAEVHHWTIADGLPDNFVRSVLVAADKSIWAGTRFGLVHIDGKAVQTFTRSDGLQSDSIGPLLQVSSKQSGTTVLWVGTSTGLCRQTAHQFHCLSSPYPANGANIITALAADRDGTLWVALHGHGLGLVKEDRILPVDNSAIPAEIVGILSDNSESLWLRSSRGLYRASIDSLRACATNRSACGGLAIDAYGRSDGMQSDEIAGEGIPTVAEGPNGELWFATRRGIAITDSQHLLSNRVPPGVAITQIHVDGVALPAGTTDISPGHRQYSFEYAGLSLNNPAATRCRYKLDGFDRGWVEAGTRRTAYYTNLPPRQYVFRVICANRDGLWSKEEAVFGFRVLTPWYRSVWMYLVGVCIAALAIFGFVQLRVRAERRRFALVLQERTRVAREVHDTLAQDLVSVSLQVEMAAQHARAGRLSDVTGQLTQTQSQVRQALDSARQSIWNLRANLSEESLPVRLAARVKSLRESNLSARLRISGEYRSASSEIENEVMRIATEAISNVERHSGATEMAVDLSYRGDSLQLQVRDNGRGFDYASTRQMRDHYGLRGLEERAALLQAHLTVESSAGNGTTVTLIAPLPTEKS